MSETKYPVTWNYISGQRPQLQQCKSQKTCTCKNMAMMQDVRLHKTFDMSHPVVLYINVIF